MNIKWYKIFLLDKEKDRKDAKLRLRVKWGKNILTFNLGYRVNIDKWITDAQRCKNNSTHGDKKVPASIINREINRYEEAVETLFARYEQEDHLPNKEEVRTEIQKNVRGIEEKHGDKSEFNSVYHQFIHDMGIQNAWTRSTYQKFNTLRNHLLDFDKNISFEKLNEAGLIRFVEYLRDDLQLHNSTIKKNLEFLKWFLRWATAKDYNSVKDYLTFSPKFKQTEKKVIFLEWEELMKVYHFEFPENKKYLERIRDVFCFCCFTSLRYSDVNNLRWNDVYNDEYILITTLKTADSLKIELNDYSRAILSKYRDRTFPSNKVLPVITNQKMNEYLKEMGYVCGIDTPITITYYRGNERFDEVHPKYELLSTHCGRRTFICNALMLGISPEVVMKWTGHSDYKSMKPYIDIADSAKKEAMDLFNKK